MTAHVFQIIDRASHDQVVAESKHQPTIIHLSNSSMPVCRQFTPEYEALAEQWAQVRFAKLEFNSETSMLFKFSPNQLPVTVAMVGDQWCRTVMGPNLSGIEKVLGELVEQAGAQARH